MSFQEHFEGSGKLTHIDGSPAVLVMMADTFRALKRANVSFDPYVENSALRLGSDLSPLVALFARPIPEDRSAVLAFIATEPECQERH